MHDPVIVTASPAPAEATPNKAPAAAAPAARKRSPRRPSTQAAVAAADAASAPVEVALKPAAPAKKAAVRNPVKAVKAAEKPQPAQSAQSVDASKAAPIALKHKLVRDSFTFPENEYAQIETLKHKALGLAHHAKKSEILRAGIAALSALPDDALVAALKAVPPLKPGRPKSGKKR